MSDPGTYQVLVDSEGWEGRRDELAEAVAAWIGLPTARVRATLAVRDQPVATFDAEDGALRLVAELERMGVRARIRRGGRRSLADLTRRRTPDDPAPDPVASETVQPGWAHAFGERARRPVTSGAGTVVGMPGAERADELQHTMLATPSEQRLPGAPEVDEAPESRTPVARPRDPSGMREASVRGGVRQARTSVPDPAPPVPSDAPPDETMARPATGWSAILGERLGEKLIDREGAPPEPADAHPTESSPGVAGRDAVPPARRNHDTGTERALSADTLLPTAPPPPVRDGATTASPRSMNDTRIHGPGAFPAPEGPSDPGVHEGASERSVPEPPAPEASEPPAPAPPPQFERVRRDDDDMPALQPKLSLPRVPEPASAFRWGLAAPGAGQAYLGDVSSGVTYALGSFLIFPWVRGALDARRQAERIMDGNTLPLRETNPTRTAAYVASYWAVVGMLVLGFVAFRESFEPATLPPIDEAAIEARARAERDRALAAEAAEREEAERVAREERERLAREEHARMVELLRDARSACDEERYIACRELAQMALEIDGTNREGHWLRAQAVNEGRALPGDTDPAVDPGPTPAEYRP